MSSPARVDPAARRVVAGEHSWSFDVDAGSGGLTVALDEGPVRLRPLRWREKLRLSRFAAAEGGLVEDQLLRLAGGGDDLPAGDGREALLALALWLDAAGDEALPLDPVLLAGVTLEVCGASGLSPADLDDRDAPDVQALWRAAREGGPGVSGGIDDDGSTRIVIVPDPEPAGAVAPQAAPAEPHTEPTPPGMGWRPTTPAHGASAPEPGAAAGAPWRDVDREPPSGPDPGPEPHGLSAPRIPPAHRAAGSADSRAAPAFGVTVGRPDRGPPSEGAAGAEPSRHQSAATVPPGPGRPVLAAGATTSAPPVADRARAPEPPDLVARREPSLPDGPASPYATIASSQPGAGDGGQLSSGPRSWPHNALEAHQPQTGRLPMPAAVGAAGLGADDLLEELARRLARAADELGVSEF